MWSLNKRINILMYLLLFMMSTNFLYYGQFILPIMCLIIFVDNKFRFRIIKKIPFILLLLFSIAFFIFSKKDFYCVMGFVLPMAYYVAENFKISKQDDIKKLLYVICLGMIFHLLLNFGYDLYINKSDAFTSMSRYDFWYGDTIQPTVIAVLYTLPIACLYYVLLYENDKRIKIVGSILFIIIMIYEVMLGRRTPILMLLIALTLSVILDSIVFGKNKKNKYVLLFVSIIIIILVIISYFIKDDGSMFFYRIREIPLIYKFLTFKFDAERLEIAIDAFKLVPSCLWGGEKMSLILDSKIHEFWLDILDYAGIIPYLLMLMYSIYNLIEMIKVSFDKMLDKKIKLLLITVYICVIMQAFLEPLMTNSSIFLICIIIVLENSYKLYKID